MNEDVSQTMKYRVKQQARGSIKGVGSDLRKSQSSVEIAMFYIYLYIVSLMFRVSRFYSGSGMSVVLSSSLGLLNWASLQLPQSTGHACTIRYVALASVSRPTSMTCGSSMLRSLKCVLLTPSAWIEALVNATVLYSFLTKISYTIIRLSIG